MRLRLGPLELQHSIATLNFFLLSRCFVFQVVHIFLYFCPTDPAGNAPKQESGAGDAPPAGEDEEKKKQKRGIVVR